MCEKDGKILVAYHKKFPVIKKDFIVPIYAGRACIDQTKDGVLTSEELTWLNDNLIGDDTGENISNRNREYSECTCLYWFWKNYHYTNAEYVGVFQYRRQLILNGLFEKAAADTEKEVYKCVHLKKDADVCAIAGISNKRILELLSRYDYILPYRTSLEKINIRSAYEDYCQLIRGTHITDVFALEDVLQKKHPDLAPKFRAYLCSPNKLMYQIFITGPEAFDNYCAWLFDILFDIDQKIDTSLYTVNGKRTMGYLAELLYGFYFTSMIDQDKVFHTGITYLE